MSKKNKQKSEETQEDAQPRMEFPDSQPIFDPWPVVVEDDSVPDGKYEDAGASTPTKAADRELPMEAAADEDDAFEENYKDDGRVPLTSIPWPIWQTLDQRLAEADKLVEELEKKTGPLSDNVLQAQQKMKLMREADEVLSEALELEKEEEQVKNDVREEADEDQKKKAKKGKGKKKKGRKSKECHDEAECEAKGEGEHAAGGFEEKAEGKDDAAGFEEEAQGKDDAAGCGGGADHAKRQKGVKRRLEFEHCSEEPWPQVEEQPASSCTWDAMDADGEPPAGVVVKKKRKMKKKGGRKSKKVVGSTPPRKNDNEAEDEPQQD
ncbi:unnamed protein product [Symbiodinium sp. CCMP2592]|nr:unnamed protein product [Symbiodinium sp. CCMP2592]